MTDDLPARPLDRPGDARVPTLLLLAAAVVVAGCLGTTGPPSADPTTTPGLFGEVPLPRLPAPDHDFTTAIDPDHGGLPGGHALPELHAHGYGLELVGYTPMTELFEGESPTGQSSGYIALDTWGTYVCVTHFGGTGGVSIVDIADPAAPRVVSSVDSGMVNSDCQFTDDGDHLVLATIAGVTDGVPEAPPPVGDAGAKGVNVYDVSDKTNPRYLFRDQQCAEINSYHNVFTAKIDGTNYIFQMYTACILAIEPDGTSARVVGHVEEARHDMWVGHHPVTGEWVLVTGAGQGTRVYDISDPADPTLLGEWHSDDFEGWHRQWPLMQTVEGRALLVVAGETGGGETEPYTVLDFTDPTDLFEVGHWEVPGKPVSPEPNFFTFSPHEFETWNGYVAAGNYHAGVWLFDVGTPARAAEPVTLGYYLPHEDPREHGGTWNRPFAFNPDVWGAYFDERGYVVTADWGSGLYVLGFGATGG